MTPRRFNLPFHFWVAINSFFTEWGTRWRQKEQLLSPFFGEILCAYKILHFDFFLNKSKWEEKCRFHNIYVRKRIFKSFPTRLLDNLACRDVNSLTLIPFLKFNLCLCPVSHTLQLRFIFHLFHDQTYTSIVAFSFYHLMKIVYKKTPWPSFYRYLVLWNKRT